MREAARLRRTTDVLRARREGVSRGDRMFVVNAIDSAASTSRLAVSVPLRLGTAVRRNRARRRARAAFTPWLGRLSRPADLVVLVRPAVLEAPFAELVRSAEDLLVEHGRLERPR